VQLAELADGRDQRLLLEIVIALGRVQWPGAPDWLRHKLAADEKLDPFLSHAAMQTLRRSRNWPAVLKLLDLPDGEPIRAMALRAVADQYAPEIVAGLIARLSGSSADRRREYAALLARVCKQSGPWEYWGYRPPPRPAKAVVWEQTAAIEHALAGLLADQDRKVRLAVLGGMQRENIAVPLDQLAAWLSGEREEQAVAAILAALPAEPADRRSALLKQVVINRQHAEVSRLRALRLLLAVQTPASAELLRELIGAVEDGAVLAELLRPYGAAAGKESIALLLNKMTSPVAEVRAAAALALADAGHADAGARIEPLLMDESPLVRRAAAVAAGRLQVASAIPALLKLAGDDEASVRCAALESLGQLRAAGAAPLAAAALADRETQLAALVCLVETGGPEHAESVVEMAGSAPPETVVMLSARALATWSAQRDVAAQQRAKMERAIQQIEGSSGLVVQWHVSGPLETETKDNVRDRLLASQAGDPLSAPPSGWRTVLAAGTEARVALPGTLPKEQSWLAWADVIVAEATAAQFVAAADGRFQVWINGRPAYQRKVPRDFAPYSDLFDGSLVAGSNRLVIEVTPSRDKSEFHLRFRRKASKAQQEQFVQAALSKTGSVERGRNLFLDAAKTQCIKCHRLGSDGERIGPELTGLGDRFSRIHIVESILEPGRTVTPGFQTLLVRLTDGQTISGIKIAEDERTLTLADAKGDKHVLVKKEIEAQQPQSQSTMPDGLVEKLTADQFVDLVTFLASEKQLRQVRPAGRSR
jgi:putative heme-binding domain-containing protein